MVRQFALLLFIIVLLGCNKLYPVDTGISTGRGVVRRVDLEHHQITLAHGTIPRLMHPMTYAYPVKNDAMLNGLMPGDSVSFTIEETKPGSFLVESVKKLTPTVK